ncbi:hypothetical protein J31TS6_28100 [Brevibacillus reuszeri]|uniref:hypothetical protein n=1 Tax=Brevibacillus reuszeri TaxID=54915 RepID=UPI001B0F377B|nr:hypothetical protein [Brevibacillus reuszeri]GIO06782.1 hypothetical protein J31TS6_28100 [Brevibacillus reuszeri]
MDDWLNKPVKTIDRPKKRGIVEYVDDQYIVVFFTIPRKERLIFSSKESFLNKIEFMEDRNT